MHILHLLLFDNILITFVFLVAFNPRTSEEGQQGTSHESEPWADSEPEFPQTPKLSQTKSTKLKNVPDWYEDFVELRRKCDEKKEKKHKEINVTQTQLQKKKKNTAINYPF